MSGKKQWKVLVWNVRGINSDDKLLAIRNAISISGCDVICLQETERLHFDLNFIKTFVPEDSINLLSCHLVGPLVVFFQCGIVFDGVTTFSDIFAVGIEFTSKLSGNVWKLFNISGPCRGEDRNSFTSWLYPEHPEL